MKKIVCLILALMMLFTLCACGAKEAPAPAAPAANEPEAQLVGPIAETPVPVVLDPEIEALPDVKLKFTMGIDAEYPPFSYMGDDGEYTGFDVEICRAACELLDWDFEVFGVNWDQKLVQLDARECDCIWSGMTIMPSMYENYVISEPYYESVQVLLVKSDSGYTGYADLAGKDVAVQLGTSGEALLAEDGDCADIAATFNKVVTCDSFLKCFTELDGGAVDALFVDLPVAAAYAAKNEGFTVLNENLGAEQYGIAFRADDAELCEAIEGAVAELVENGTYAEIAAKYPDIVNNLIFLAE